MSGHLADIRKRAKPQKRIFIIPAFSSTSLPKECLIPTLKSRGREY